MDEFPVKEAKFEEKEKGKGKGKSSAKGAGKTTRAKACGRASMRRRPVRAAAASTRKAEAEAALQGSGDRRRADSKTTEISEALRVLVTLLKIGTKKANRNGNGGVETRDTRGK